jgi:hypothetical protein
MAPFFFYRFIHKKIISLREGEEEAGGHHHLVSLHASLPPGQR